MHELSIMMGIVEIVESEANNRHASRVESVELEIGKLSGIELDALTFIWDSAVKGTLLEGAQREILVKEGIARCPDCKDTFPVKELFDPCPKCENYFTDLIQGQELRVKSLVIS
jgi:hydrogenase nickel incorporation protein HypA/HybF